MYMMATFLMSAALYFYLKLLKSNKFKLPDIIFCNLFIFLSFMTFYGSAFFISALYVYLFIKKRWKLFTFVHPGFLLSVLILLPLIIHQLSNAHAALATVKNWSQVLGKATLKNLFLFPLKFSLGRISWEPKKLYYFTGVIWTAFVFLLTWLSGKRNQLFAFLFVFPIGLGIIFSVFSPLLQYFRFIYLIIPLSILLALFSYNKWYRYILIGGFIVFSSLYIFFPQFHREDWKSLALNISQPVYAIPSSMDAFTYYRPDVKINSLFAVDKANEKIITVIPYSADIYGFDYRSVLLKNGYRNTKTIAYRGLTVETYTR